MSPLKSAAPLSTSGGFDAWFTPGKVLLLLGVFLLAAFPEVLFAGHAFFYRDAACFNYPNAYYFRESYRRGEWPLWNPLNNCGIPFLAQWNTTTLYPLSLLIVLLPFPQGMAYFSFAHFFLAAAGMYFLAHRWTQNRFAPVSPPSFFHGMA